MNAGIVSLYSEVKSMPVKWLWYPFIAVGKISLLQGDPGDGKSTMMLRLIAEITNGGSTPDPNGTYRVSGILCPDIHVIMFELNDAELYSGPDLEMNWKNNNKSLKALVRLEIFPSPLNKGFFIWV